MTSTVWEPSWRYGENVFGKKSDLVHMTAVKAGPRSNQSKCRNYTIFELLKTAFKQIV